MYHATNEKHASPSGADLNPENRIPPTEGDFDSPIDEAKALLMGKTLRREKPYLLERVEEFSAPAPEITLSELVESFPDWEIDDDHNEIDDPFPLWYNNLNSVSRALIPIQADVLTVDLIHYPIKPARYRHEVLQGQRRALVALLAVAEPETFGPIEALIRKQEEELRAAVAAALTPARPRAVIAAEAILAGQNPPPDG